MLASQMICMPCGYQGSIDTQCASIGNSRSETFRYLGHNPFSGEMHYQCPECKSCLNVDPADIFKMDPARGLLSAGLLEKDPYSFSVDTVDFLWQLPVTIKDGVRGLTRYISKNLGRIL